MDSSSTENQAVIVSSVTGTVIATDADGNTRILQPGDTVYPGETVTASDGQAVLTSGGESFSIQPGQPLVVPAMGLNPAENLDEEVLDEESQEEAELENNQDEGVAEQPDIRDQSPQELNDKSAQSTTDSNILDTASLSSEEASVDGNLEAFLANLESNQEQQRPENNKSSIENQSKNEQGLSGGDETRKPLPENRSDFSSKETPLQNAPPSSNIEQAKGTPASFQESDKASYSADSGAADTAGLSGGGNLSPIGNSGLGAPIIASAPSALGDSSYKSSPVNSGIASPGFQANSPISVGSFSGGSAASTTPGNTNSPIALEPTATNTGSTADKTFITSSEASQTSSQQTGSTQTAVSPDPSQAGSTLSPVNAQTITTQSPSENSGNTGTTVASSDSGGSSQPASPNITTENDTAAVAYNARLLEQTSILANDTGESLTVTQMNDTTVSSDGTTTVQGQYGTLTIQADGTYSYTAADVDLSSDLAASWQFNEAQGATVAQDTSITDQQTDNASLTGNAAIVEGGVTGNALQLNVGNNAPSFSNATLLSHFSMDNIGSNTTQLSSSVGTSTGTSSGGAFVGSSTGSAHGDGHLELDGSEHINIETGLDASATDVTLSFWFRWDGTESQMVASFGSYDIWIDHGRIGFNTWNQDIYGIDLDSLQLAPGSNGLANEWHHITATFHDGDPTQSVLRVDGIPQSLTGTDHDPTNPNQAYSYNADNADIHQTLNFGGSAVYDNIAPYQTTAGIDDLQIYSGSMTDAEATSLYETSLVQSLGEGQAEVTQDSREINIPADGIVDLRTVTLAFQPDSSNDLSGRQVLFEEGGTYNGLIIYIEDGTLYAGAYNNLDSGWSEFFSTDLSTVDTSEFHRITLSLDGNAGTMTAWLDGTEIGHSTSAESIRSHSGNVSIGNNSSEDIANQYHDGSTTTHGTSYPYSGLIDDVRIYNRALTATEAQVLANEGSEQTDSFTYTTTDSSGGTATATLDINLQESQNQGPDANNDVLNVGADQSVTVNSLTAMGLLGNDTDGNGDALTVTHIGDTEITAGAVTTITGQYGSLLVAADGSYSYAPFNSSTAGGTENFTYTVSDGQSTSTAQLTVNVIGSTGASTDYATIQESSSDNASSAVSTATYLVTREGNDAFLTYFDSATGQTDRLGQLTGGVQSYETSISMSPSGVLYGIDNTNLYTIDPSTQQMTVVGSLGVSDVSTMTGLAVAPDGTIYATSYDGHLYSVNSSTGAATDMGDISAIGSHNFSDLAWHDGALYTTSYYFDATASENVYQLMQITPDGNTFTTQDIGSPDFAMASHTIYSTGNELIVGNNSVDTATGALTPLQHSMTGEQESAAGNASNAAYSPNIDGNVLTNDGTMQSVSSILDINGNAVNVSANGATINTGMGSLLIRADGSYTYTLNNDSEFVDNLTADDTATERFVYTATDGNGNTAQAVLSINIQGADELAVVENTITGDNSDNVLIGGMDNDSISGGEGNDILTGGNGIDFFTWTSGDEGTSGSPAIDTVTDFHVGSQGDVLNLADLLPESASGSLDQYLSFTSSEGSTTIGVSTSAGGPVVQEIVLQDVDLAANYGTTDTTTLINNLTNDGNLMT